MTSKNTSPTSRLSVRLQAGCATMAMSRAFVPSVRVTLQGPHPALPLAAAFTAYQHVRTHSHQIFPHSHRTAPSLSVSAQSRKQTVEAVVELAASIMEVDELVLPATARTSRDTAVAWLLGVMNALPLTIYIDHTTAAQQSWFFITYGIIMQPWQWQCDAAKEREIQMASARMLQRTTARTAHTSPIYGCHIRFVCRCVSIR